MLYLFGSRNTRSQARADSDVDVILDGDCDDALTGPVVERLRVHAIENGGYLDLFYGTGGDLWSAYDPDGMRCVLVSRRSWNWIYGDAKPISEAEVAALCIRLLATHGKYRGKPRDTDAGVSDFVPPHLLSPTT